MQSAETVLGVIRERGRRGLPLEHSEVEHWRAGSGDKPHVRFGKGPTEKDPNHGHLAGGLLHHRDLLKQGHAATCVTKCRGRPPTVRSIRTLVVRLARENAAPGI
jgi:hypothetical protein